MLISVDLFLSQSRQIWQNGYTLIQFYIFYALKWSIIYPKPVGICRIFPATGSFPVYLERGLVINLCYCNILTQVKQNTETRLRSGLDTCHFCQFCLVLIISNLRIMSMDNLQWERSRHKARRRVSQRYWRGGAAGPRRDLLSLSARSYFSYWSISSRCFVYYFSPRRAKAAMLEGLKRISTVKAHSRPYSTYIFTLRCVKCSVSTFLFISICFGRRRLYRSGCIVPVPGQK